MLTSLFSNRNIGFERLVAAGIPREEIMPAATYYGNDGSILNHIDESNAAIIARFYREKLFLPAFFFNEKTLENMSRVADYYKAENKFNDQTIDEIVNRFTGYPKDYLSNDLDMFFKKLCDDVIPESFYPRHR